MEIKQNILNIEDNIKKINPQAKLLAVIKHRSVAEIENAIQAGINIIGISKWQEFKDLFVVRNAHTCSLQAMQNPQFHFIGHLQKNKVKEVIKYFDCVQSVDSLELAEKINSECQKINKKINILLQINISNDPDKHGFKIGEINNILVRKHLACRSGRQNFASLRQINIIGFMAITARQSLKQTRMDFQKMKKLFDEYKNQYNLTELSMGMSNDYLVALEEGATMVRVGSAIFA